ncbi:MAG: mannose-1-phosphate guanylyltransferase [Acidobacteriota bacterium]
MRVVPFILAGGQGQRLWPASRRERPKQFLPLVGEVSLIRATYQRVAPLARGGPIYVLTGEETAGLVREALPDLPADRIWTEPLPRNTGPSIAWALHEAMTEHGREVAAFFPADHHFGEEPALREAVDRAAEAAAATGRIGLLGVKPDRVESGYGHVQVGPGADRGGREVVRFLEKPPAARARELSRREDVFWNSGIFVLGVEDGLRIIRKASPALARFLQQVPPAGLSRQRGGGARPRLEAAFRAVKAVPFDVAVLERSPHRVLVPLEAGWSDLGSWQAVWEACSKDAAGNVVSGAATVLDSEGCLVRGGGRTVAVLGAKDLVIISCGDAVLVCPRERAQEVRRIVEAII